MASKVGRFVSQVRDIVQDESRRQTNEILDKFNEILPDDESADTPDDESADTPDDESATATVDDLLALKYDLMEGLAVTKKELERELNTIYQQVSQGTESTISIVEPTPSTTQSVEPTPSTTQSQDDNVSNTIISEEVFRDKDSKKNPWGLVLSTVSKGFSKVTAPIKSIYTLFLKYVSDRSAALTLLIMTIITVVAGIVSAIKWVYEKINESLDSLWSSISGAFDSLLKWLEEYVIIPLAKGINWIADSLGFEPPFDNYITKYEDTGVPIGTSTQKWVVTTEGAPWLENAPKESTPDYKAQWGGMQWPNESKEEVANSETNTETETSVFPQGSDITDVNLGETGPQSQNYQHAIYKTDVKEINIYGSKASDYYDVQTP